MCPMAAMAQVVEAWPVKQPIAPRPRQDAKASEDANSSQRNCVICSSLFEPRPTYLDEVGNCTTGWW